MDPILLPRTLDGIIMWIISFLMLFLLVGREKQAKAKNLGFWRREDFIENFIILFVFALTIINYIAHVFFIGGSETMEQPIHILVPATVYSMLLSLIAFAVWLVVLLYYLGKKERRFPPLSNFLFSVLVALLFWGAGKVGRVLLMPYGTLMTSIVHLVSDICVFGLLLPYCFASIILYMVNSIRER